MTLDELAARGVKEEFYVVLRNSERLLRLISHRTPPPKPTTPRASAPRLK